VTGNTAAFGGGILSVNTLTLNQTTVSGNVPDDCAC
jgi:predicted outer membrane repeat protein